MCSNQSTIKTLLLIVVAALCFNCADNPTMAGGSAEQGNAFTVAGMVGGTSGKGLAAMKVVARPSDYIPAQGVFPYDSLSALTDAEGRFAIEGLDSGIYTLTAFDSARTVFAIQRDQVVAENDSSFFLTADSSARVVVPTSDTGTTALVYIPGTEIHTEVTSGDTAVLTVPGVSLNITARNRISGGYLDTVYQDVPVVAGAVIAPSVVPEAPAGPSAGLVDSTYIFTAVLPDIGSSAGPVEFRFYFGNRDTTAWQPEIRGLPAPYVWSAPGVYEVTVQFRFLNYTLPDRTTALLYSAWSPLLLVTITE